MKKVIVVGGGAAGMMAAYAAAQNGHRVTLLERNEKLGKKIYITGKGRCNVTNAGDTTEFFDSVVSNPKFLYSSIYGFDANAVMDFFERNGCPLKIERGDRVFPVSDHSSDIIRCLEQTLIRQHVMIKKNTMAKKLLVNSAEEICGVEAMTSGEKGAIAYDADAVVLATGGKSYPVTGSDGNMHNLLENLGHKIIPMRPGLVPLETEGELCRQMQGLSLKNVSLTLLSGNKTIYEGFGEMLFTHFGLSGPLVLSAASYLNARTQKAGQKCTAVIDLKPSLTYEQLDKRILRDFEKFHKKQFKNSLGELLPAKMIPLIPEMTGIPAEKPVNEITREERRSLLEVLKGMTIPVTGTRDFNEAIITIGGVDTHEVNPSTMESKKIPGLYLCGEMLDVDALTGGYNLQIAWSTGYLAGCSIEM
ncbi:MAG: NAD(P)/FAD-dependent oxidoreductase [Lachnospiraceae bacterium]|nr:NAD(P)/FAD-dependent oxidoreductase [Lachnospiraceae bacterium]